MFVQLTTPKYRHSAIGLCMRVCASVFSMCWEIDAAHIVIAMLYAFACGKLHCFHRAILCCCWSFAALSRAVVARKRPEKKRIHCQLPSACVSGSMCVGVAFHSLIDFLTMMSTVQWMRILFWIFVFYFSLFWLCERNERRSDRFTGIFGCEFECVAYRGSGACQSKRRWTRRTSKNEFIRSIFYRIDWPKTLNKYK